MTGTGDCPIALLTLGLGVGLLPLGAGTGPPVLSVSPTEGPEVALRLGVAMGLSPSEGKDSLGPLNPGAPEGSYWNSGFIR